MSTTPENKSRKKEAAPLSGGADVKELLSLEKKYNLLDYLMFMGGFSLSELPFNEVDSVILSCLAYIKFEHIWDTDGMSIADAYALFEKKNEAKTEDCDESLRRLFALLAHSRRFSSCGLFHFESHFSHDDELQFSAVSIRLSNGILFVAFRGTDGTLLGWKEDFNMVFMKKTSGQSMAGDYLNRHYYKKTGIKGLYLGGHSKGGNFAVSSALFCRKGLLKKIKRIYSNDGPGFCREIVESERYALIQPKVKSIVPALSIIGMLMYSNFETGYIKSLGKGFEQHNPFNWQLAESAFVRLPQPGEKILLMDSLLEKWMESLSREERKIAVDSIYKILVDADNEFLKEVLENKIKTLQLLKKELSKLPKEQEGIIKGALGKLRTAAKTVLKDEIWDEEEDSLLEKGKKLLRLITK